MLILARESRGLSQTALASATSLSQSNISRYESGDLSPADEHLDRLSRALEYPVSFFFQTDPVYGYGSSCVYHRKRQSLPVTDYRTLLARINILRMRLARLLRDIELNASNAFPRMDIEDYGSGAHVAKLLRGMWRLPPGPVPNLVTAIESAGGLIVPCAFNTAKLDAISQWLPGMPPIFFINAAIPVDRLRFTLAHELGHVIMHVIPSTNLEREADEFAAEFLMPAKDIGHQLRPLSLQRLAMLKPYWRVSMAALARRARDLNKASDSQYKRIVTHMSRLGYRLTEPVPIPPEEPTLVRSIIETHLSDGLSIGVISRILESTESEFAAQFLPAEGRRFRVVGS
jgi:Zn-dependent peptidase ImmA (M78 family)